MEGGNRSRFAGRDGIDVRQVIGQDRKSIREFMRAGSHLGIPCGEWDQATGQVLTKSKYEPQDKYDYIT